MIGVVLVDDQTLVRQGLRSLVELTPDIRVVAEAGDGVEALAALERTWPDVLLLDVRMPRMGGLDLLRQLRARGAPPPTVLLTTFDDDSVLLEAVQLGASGFLLKDVTRDQLADAIRAVARGESLMRPAVTERVLRGLQAAPRTFESLERPDVLTSRELEVLRLMAGGFSNREIAQALGTAEGTAKNHASSVLSKLGVRDRTRAVLRALELGWI